MKKILTALAVLTLALTGFVWSAANATKPNPEHKVVICHATPADTAANGWHAIEVDVASVGYQHSGHQNEHTADIIPAWSYTDGEHVFSYDGKNLNTIFGGSTGSIILANGCVAPSNEPTETPDPTPPVVTEPPGTPPVVNKPPKSEPKHHHAPHNSVPASLPNTGA